jgi:hypothetical protein
MGVISDFTYKAASQTSSLRHRLEISTLESMNLGFDAVGKQEMLLPAVQVVGVEDSFSFAI